MVEYNRDVLPEGLVLVTESIPGIHSVTMGVWIKVGSRHESRNETGLAHFLEHMLFKGTSRRDAKAIALSLESLGGHLDAFTGKEYSCYYARVLDEHLPQALDVIADIMHNSLFEKEKIEREKQVILEEIKSLLDTPDDLIHELFAKTIWDGHPLGESILGTTDSVKSFAVDQIKRFHREMYSADKVIIAAAGKINHGELRDRIAALFDFPVKGEPEAPVREVDPEVRQSYSTMDISQTHICLGCATFPFRHPDRFTLLAINTLMGGGMSSRLFQNVREQMGLAYNIYSYLDFMHDTGIFGIYLGVDPSRTQQALDVVKGELADLSKQGLEPGELDAVKSQLKGNLILGLESTSNRMNRLAKMEMYLNNYVTIEETIADIENVKEEEIMRLAREILNPDRFSVTMLGPKSSEGANLR